MTEFAKSYRISRPEHPRCDLCSHVTERVFSASDETHDVWTPKDHDTIYICVSCWSKWKTEDAGE